ncbi:MAG: hypothetical protein L3J46_09725, partial [Kangiellaceae bacterium]|nr:hypothetical protein [Kangiellaceae bacterium]
MKAIVKYKLQGKFITMILVFIVGLAALGQASAKDIKKQLEGIAIWQLLNLCRRNIRGKEKTSIQKLLSYIRRLILLNDDRDLRQLPTAAKNINAVKLMTIHGSKGLEFDVVHIPGLVTTGLPRSKKSHTCLPPDGLIDGMDRLSGREAINHGHEEEEECIFFVSLSRAKTRLFLYAFSKMGNGNNRKKSKFLERISLSITSLENNMVGSTITKT